MPMSSKFTKKSVVKVFGPLGEDAGLRTVEVGVQDSHPTHQHRHLRRAERQRLRALDQQFLRAASWWRPFAR